MDVQKAFFKFNENIRLDFEYNNELMTKRDIIINKLKESDRLPSFDYFNQGSYKLKTGINPTKQKDYDIDVGLIFSDNINDYSPIDLKETIKDILYNHTNTIPEIKKPCVTVTYSKHGEASFHVDLVTYLHDDSSDQLYIGKGIRNNTESIKWEKADPKGLIKYINDYFNDNEVKEQYRRIVRYIKEWKRLKFSCTGHAEPPSIAINLLVLKYFQYIENNDFRVLINIVNSIRHEFVFVQNENNRFLYKITLKMPYELKFDNDIDIFGKMTLNQMTDFKDRLDKFYNDLIDAYNENDETKKFKLLKSIFGECFPDIPISDTARKQDKYIASSSTSGIK